MTAFIGDSALASVSARIYLFSLMHAARPGREALHIVRRYPKMGRMDCFIKIVYFCRNHYCQKDKLY